MPSNFIQRLHLLQNLPDVDLSKVKEFLFKVEEYIQRYTDEERICIDEYFCFVLGLNPGPHKAKYKDFYLVPTKENSIANASPMTISPRSDRNPIVLTIRSFDTYLNSDTLALITLAAADWDARPSLLDIQKSAYLPGQ